jgi:nucleoside-diphosphate-sugar epimerase
MKIVIIGCGYVGSALSKFWKDAGFHLTATTRKPERKKELREVADEVFILPGDGKDFDELLDNVSLIALTLASDNFAAFEKTYLHTAQTLAKTLKNHPTVNQVIYTSSTSVYGEQQGAWVDETKILMPQNERERILLATEKCLLECHKESGPNVCILRLGEIYGPGREIADRLKKMSSKPIPGTGENYTNLIHREDIVQAMDFAREKKLNGIYNLCNDVHIPRKELYNRLCKDKGIPQVSWDPTLSNPFVGNKRISNAKIKALDFIFHHQEIF